MPSLPRFWTKPSRPAEPFCEVNGKVVVGFDGEGAAAEWAFHAARTRRVLVSARDKYLGKFSGDGMYFLKATRNSIFWSEIWDEMIETDNGRIGMVQAKSTVWVPPETVIFLDGGAAEHAMPAQRCGREEDLVPAPLAKEITILPHAVLRQSIRRQEDGSQFLVVENPDTRSRANHLVVWRGDGRHTIGLVVSGHSRDTWALDALDPAEDDFATPARTATGKITTHRDSQRERVYRWEDRLCANNALIHAELTPDQCQAICAEVCRAMAVRPCKLVFSDRLENTCHYKLGVITLANRWGRTRAYVLHEAAHHVDDCRRRKRGQGHGPEFVNVLIDLLVQFGHVNRDLAVSTAKDAGLRL